jgi:hypothetical protein
VVGLHLAFVQKYARYIVLNWQQPVLQNKQGLIDLLRQSK